MPHEAKKDVKIGPVLRAYTRTSLRYPFLLVVIVVGTIFGQGANIAAPLYLRDFINVLSKGTPSDFVGHALFVLLLIYSAINLLGWAARRIVMLFEMRITATVMSDLSNAAFANLIHHDHNFFTSNFAGSLTRRVTRYARAYEQVLDSIVFNFLPTFLFAAGSIAVLYQRSVWLGIGLLVWVIVFIVLQVVMTKWH